MDWQAQWIWGGSDPAPRNGMVQFRRVLSLTPRDALVRLHISADARYILYFNGQRIGYGPARAYPTAYLYDTYEVQDLAHAGANTIAVLVCHWGEGTFQQRVTRGGLLVQVATDDGILLISDATWKTKRDDAFIANTPRVAPQLPWEEHYDARLADVGWLEATYSDQDWEAATVIGPVATAPWGALQPRPVPFLTDEPIAPISVTPQGSFRRPEIVAPMHLTALVAPGDLTENRHQIDLLLATVLHLPTAGTVTLRMCAIYGDIAQVVIDGAPGGWHEATFRDADDHVLAHDLVAGDHLILLDWQGKTHDLDLTLTFSGVPGMTAYALGSHDEGIWSVAQAPGPARALALAATTAAAVLASGAAWQPLAPRDTPVGDVYMDVVGSVLTAPITDAAPGGYLPLTLPSVAGDLAQEYLLDFGRMLIGWIDLELEAAAGTVIDIVGCEGIQEGQLQWAKQMNNSMRYICRDGKQRFISTQRRGFRYLVVAVHGAAAPVTLHRVDARLATHPAPLRGRFRSADPRLDAIWATCAYTLRLCTEDTFTDCPTYEQTLWIGDAYTDALVQQSVHGDMRVVVRGLELAAQSLRHLPLVNAQIPSDWEDRDSWIPNWSWLWVLGCRAYYWLSGDRAFVERIFPALAQQADWLVTLLEQHPDGLFTLDEVTHLLDWAELDDGPNHTTAHEQMFGVAALLATAELAEVLTDVAAAQRYRDHATRLRTATNRIFWSATANAYVDSRHPDGVLSTHVSQPVNILALAMDIPDAQQRAAIERVLTAPPADWSPTGSPWMYSFALLELARQGRITPMLRLIRERWGAMLDRGATTIWETFPGWITGRWTRSWCHAWGTMPAHLLSTYVAGVQPLVPGFTRVLVAPRLGDLAWAEAVVPTPLGDIFLAADAQEQPMKITLTLPAQIDAVVALPIADNGAVPYATDAEITFVQQSDRWVAEVPAGSHLTFRYDVAQNAIASS